MCDARISSLMSRPCWSNEWYVCFVKFPKSSYSRLCQCRSMSKSTETFSFVQFALFHSVMFELLSCHVHRLTSSRFKRGKMYRYEGTSWKQSTFIEFVEHGYEKVKSELVPPVPSVLCVFRLRFDMFGLNRPIVCSSMDFVRSLPVSPVVACGRLMIGRDRFCCHC
jgi:hypothetical protein